MTVIHPSIHPSSCRGDEACVWAGAGEGAPTFVRRQRVLAWHVVVDHLTGRLGFIRLCSWRGEREKKQLHQSKQTSLQRWGAGRAGRNGAASVSPQYVLSILILFRSLFPRPEPPKEEKRSRVFKKRPGVICIFITSFAYKSLAAWGAGASHRRNGLPPAPTPP